MKLIWLRKWFLFTITLLYGMILCLWTSYIFEYIGTWIIFEGKQIIKMWFYEIFEGGKYIYMKLIMDIFMEMVMDMYILNLRMLKYYIMSMPCDTQIQYWLWYDMWFIGRWRFRPYCDITWFIIDPSLLRLGRQGSMTCPPSPIHLCYALGRQG